MSAESVEARKRSSILRLEDFHFDLPKGFIAGRAAAPRDSSKLMVLDRAAGTVEHSVFESLPFYLEEGDCLVINETKVMPSRLNATRVETGGKVELLFVRRKDELHWEVMVRPARRLKEGTCLSLDGGADARIVERLPGATFLLRVRENFEEHLEAWGEMPIPPYIKRPADDRDRESYQTVYARVPGSCAAPTAGLHFSNEILRRLEARGVQVARLILHVGPGTFKPLKPGPLADQKLDPEYYEIPAETCRVVNRTRGRGGKVFAVGTSTARALETAADESGTRATTGGPQGIGLLPGKGWTDRFIYPPYEFKAVDALVTNFHLPGSSVLLLVCAFAGKDLVFSAYEEAKRHQYRFYSYGDAMLVV